MRRLIFEEKNQIANSHEIYCFVHIIMKVDIARRTFRYTECKKKNKNFTNTFSRSHIDRQRHTHTLTHALCLAKVRTCEWQNEIILNVKFENGVAHFSVSHAISN